MPFSFFKTPYIIPGLCAVLLGGAFAPLPVLAEDAPAPVASVHTSWADSVRQALASRAQRLKQDAQWTQQGVASWYGRRFHGHRTSSGDIFNTDGLTAAHRTLPIGTKLRVTSEDTGRSVIVTVNDRGPFIDNRIIDLSHAAASQLGMLNSGTAHVKIAPLTQNESEATEVADAGDDSPNTSAMTVHPRTKAAKH